jgi:PAS domain S-box-containing protein
MMERSTEKKFKIDFQEILNLFSEPAAIVTEDRLFVCINQAFGSIVGDQTAELLGKPIEELSFFNSEAKAALIGNLAKRLRGEKVEPYEVPLNVNGKTLYFEPVGKRIDYLDKPADIVIMHDVSKRQKAQKRLMEEIDQEKEKLLQSESKVASILESSPDAVAFCSMDGKVLECNQAMIDLFHYKTKTDLVGKNGFELLLIDDSANASKAIDDLLEKGIVSSTELRSTAADGEELLVIIKS